LAITQVDPAPLDLDVGRFCSRRCWWPLSELDNAIAECADAKTLIALMWLARRLNGPLHPQGGTAAEAKLEG